MKISTKPAANFARSIVIPAHANSPVYYGSLKSNKTLQTEKLVVDAVEIYLAFCRSLPTCYNFITMIDHFKLVYLGRV